MTVNKPPGTAKQSGEDIALPEGFFVPEESLPHAFAVVGNRVSAMLEKMYSEQYGLTVVGWRIIAILGSHAPLSAKALAELTAMDAVNISRATEQLTSLKFVSRRTDPIDRRRVVLRLSKKGEEVFRTVLPLFHAAENALLSNLSQEDVLSLRRIMQSLVDRSASVLGEDVGWQSLLEQFGYETARGKRPKEVSGVEE